jgi:hypothetical protein
MSAPSRIAFSMNKPTAPAFDYSLVFNARDICLAYKCTVDGLSAHLERLTPEVAHWLGILVFNITFRQIWTNHCCSTSEISVRRLTVNNLSTTKHLEVAVCQLNQTNASIRVALNTESATRAGTRWKLLALEHGPRYLYYRIRNYILATQLPLSLSFALSFFSSPPRICWL